MVLGMLCEAEATPDTALTEALESLTVLDCDGASDSGLSGVSVGLSEGEGLGVLGLGAGLQEVARMIEEEPTSLSRLQYNVLLADNIASPRLSLLQCVRMGHLDAPAGPGRCTAPRHATPRSCRADLDLADLAHI
ncbi:Ribokinase [Frankliniella fusca]|uniref:Ribokinase n=1 Tax=Frankliniella fusca TaxID=407009 RepID=A0AAE1GZV2_9NEOP|nr:Ribokinase [Frankliniella fusca]